MHKICMYNAYKSVYITTRGIVHYAFPLRHTCTALEIANTPQSAYLAGVSVRYGMRTIILYITPRCGIVESIGV